MQTIKNKTALLLSAFALILFLLFCTTYLWHIKFYQPFNLYVPFLVLALTPFVFIAFLFSNSATTYVAPDQKQVAKGIFFLCLFFFLVLQGYGIYYYKLRLQLDGAADMFFYSGLPPELLPEAPYYRYAYLLNKLLLKPCFELHLPVTVIARIYCLSDACFYLLVAGAVLTFTRRYDYAAAVLAAPVLTAGTNFYFIGTELFLSGAIMVLYVAVYNHTKDGYLKYSILFICLFFMVWSHPLMLLVLAVFMAGIYNSPKQWMKDKWVLAFLLANVVVRVLLLSEYDRGKINRFGAGQDNDYWINTFVQYLKAFWYVAVMAAWCIYLVVKQKSITAYKGFLVVPVMLYYCNAGRLSVSDPYFTKFFYAVHLFILMQATIISATYIGFKKTVWVAAAVMLTGGLYSLLSQNHGQFTQRLVLMEKLNSMCYAIDANQSKWFVREDSLLNSGPAAKHYESISFSAYQNIPTAIQVVRGNAAVKNRLDSLPVNEFSIDETMVSNSSVLNPYYYHFKAGHYKELILDPAKLNWLRGSH